MVRPNASAWYVDKNLEYRERLTLRHVYGVDVQSNCEPRLREWATDVWDAYTSQHDIARRWIGTALKRK